MNKKGWLDFLFYEVGDQQFDFRINGLTKNEDRIISTPWKKYSEVVMPLNPWENNELWWVNNREILPNEIVIDLEEKKYLRTIIKNLKKRKANFHVYKTYSRGYHIHIWFDRVLTPEEKLILIRNYFGDEQKAYNGTTIALEGAKHWKSGKTKEEIKWK